MKRIFFIMLLGLFSSTAFAQQLSGRVFEQASKSDTLTPLPGVTVFWKNTQVGTTTDASGTFNLQRLTFNGKDTAHMLVVKFVGYEDKIIHVDNFDKPLSIVLKEGKILSEVTIEYRQGTTAFLTLDPRNTQVLSQGELRKAACCNLAESFETNPSVDASFTDAVTGTKQIQMLGLSGKYTQIMQENIPTIRGLSTIYGLEFIPGPWVNAIYLSKGAGSVVNGFESITGQINVDMKKPGNAEKFHFNMYANQSSRTEMNVVYDKALGKYWETTLLLHGKNQSLKFDHNHDGFIDNPLSTNLIFHNQWHYNNFNKGIQLETGVGAVLFDSKAGQTDFFSSKENARTLFYGVETNIQRVNAFLKAGYLFPDEDYKSIGSQWSVAHHKQQSMFGENTYNGTHTNFQANIIFQDEIDEHDVHTYKAGASFLYDGYIEQFNTLDLSRVEIIPGAFAEYAYNKDERINVVTGVRADYNSLYEDVFVTPRLHARYSFTENTSLKLGAGRGRRTPNVISENIGLLASSRRWNFITNPNFGSDGILPEVAWNVGLNLTKKFKLDYREGTIAIDVYRTDFENQLVIDVDANPQQVNVYNLFGKSYSNSAQIEINYELIKRLDVRLAYRWLDVKTTQLMGDMTRPFVPTHRAFANVAYETRKKKEAYWQFDITTLWTGQQRIPITTQNPEQFRLAENADAFWMINAQITRIFSEKFDMYLGVENALSYTQQHPIVDAQNPFGTYFDSSMVWAPIFGRMFYIGLRYTLK
jgi:outer membrane receptor for ferrienterochelin and colicins